MKMQTEALKKAAEHIFSAALKAVDPFNALAGHTDALRLRYRSGGYRRLLVAGFGKAACPMTRAVEAAFAGEALEGAVVTKYGHLAGQGSLPAPHKRIKRMEAGHPIPDESGVRATEEILRLLADADERTLVGCLISGGASALLVSPYEGISLADKQEITGLLLKAGADIHELNTVRKHISRVKGGRLAEIASPAPVVSFILSDVIGDRLDVIASGPTAPDRTTFKDALRVLEKYGVTEKAPGSVLKVLRRGAEGLIPETPKEGNAVFDSVDNIIIGSNGIALSAAKKSAEEMGLRAEILSAGLTGEAREAGRWLARRAKDAKAERPRGPGCLICGGETTVTVKGNGKGGRNTELALSFAREIDGVEGVALLSAGTDGTDGPTDAAGAVIDGHTVKKAKEAGLDPEEYLDNNDSYSFFKKTGELLVTGPTGTNVMDIQVVVIE